MAGGQSWVQLGVAAAVSQLQKTEWHKEMGLSKGKNVSLLTITLFITLITEKLKCNNKV